MYIYIYCLYSLTSMCWLITLCNTYHIAGNFREVQIFAIFATHDQNAKIRTAKYETAKIWTRELLEIFTPCVLCASLARSDVWRWHYSAISNRRTTSYPFPRNIFRPLLARRRERGVVINRENFFWRGNGIFAKIWTRENFPLYGNWSSIETKPLQWAVRSRPGRTGCVPLGKSTLFLTPVFVKDNEMRLNVGLFAYFFWTHP